MAKKAQAHYKLSICSNRLSYKEKHIYTAELDRINESEIFDTKTYVKIRNMEIDDFIRHETKNKERLLKFCIKILPLDEKIKVRSKLVKVNKITLDGTKL